MEGTNKRSLLALRAVGSRVDAKRDILIELCIFVGLRFSVRGKIDVEQHELV